MGNESTAKTLIVAVLLCIVCSVLVSTAAVKLKPLQQKNKALFTKRNILMAAGISDEGKSVDELFKKIEIKIVDLSTGDYNLSLSPEKFNQKAAVKLPSMSVAIPRKKDLAKIKRRSKLVKVYLVKEENEIKTIVLPIHGKALWSTMYAFLALNGDGNTVKGFSFYDHGETPGLGGEVDNPLWKQQWVGKKLFDNNGKLAIQVIKGKVRKNNPNAIYQADGLSGATLTTVAIDNLMHYWLKDHGFGKYLEKLKSKGGNNG